MPLINICAICKQEFKSLLLDRALANQEVGISLKDHLETKHKEEFKDFLTMDLGKITVLAQGISILNRFVEFSPDDALSQEEHETNCETLMDLMGFPPEDDDSDDGETSPDEKEPIPASNFLKDPKLEKPLKKLIIFPN